MGRILVGVTPLAGHVNPMRVVAEHLSGQGHDVVFHSSDLFREKVEACGLCFRSLLGNANYDYHQLGELIPELRTAVSPTEQANCYVKHMFGVRIPDQDRGLRQIIGEGGIDLVLIDVGFCGIFPMLLREESRPPVISCGVIAPVWHDPGFSVFTGPNDTPEGRRQHLEHSRQYNEGRAPGYRHVDAVLKKLGLAVPGGYNSNSLYRLPDLFLQFGEEEFEYPLYERPANLHFVGPILPRHESASTAVAWLANLENSRPVVFVTQGTLTNFDFNQLVNPALLGLAQEDVQVIVTAGGSNADQIVVRHNVIVERYIPYALVLPRTSVFVTNGGYNGVQQALSYGVPIVAAGVSEDKGEVCARVSWSRAGIGLKTGTPTAEQIRDAVRQILHDASYRERAETISARIAKTDALKTIAEIVEVVTSNGLIPS